MAMTMAMAMTTAKGYIQDVPLEAPKIEIEQKWYFDGPGPGHGAGLAQAGCIGLAPYSLPDQKSVKKIGPAQMTCPKSCRIVFKKQSKNSLSKIWDQKKGP